MHFKFNVSQGLLWCIPQTQKYIQTQSLSLALFLSSILPPLPPLLSLFLQHQNGFNPLKLFHVVPMVGMPLVCLKDYYLHLPPLVVWQVFFFYFPRGPCIVTKAISNQKSTLAHCCTKLIKNLRQMTCNWYNYTMMTTSLIIVCCTVFFKQFG